MDKAKKFLKEYLPYIIILMVVILLKTFVFTMVIVHGTSMNDTLHNKDVMVLNKIGIKTGKIKRFDIVVINYDKTRLIKRVIGLPGEMVEYHDGILYINNKEVKDPYDNGKTPNIDILKLNDDEYIVLGDNRDNSLDSSELGPFKRKQIIGKTNFTIWPFNRFGKKD